MILIDPQSIVFIHGLYGSSQGFKATHLRALFPGMLTPDFPGSLEERLAQLETLLREKTGWTLIGSSLGGLMAADYTSRHPARVRKLILLAPALIWPDFVANLPDPVDVPTVILHGRADELIPVDEVKVIAEKIFLNLSFQPVDDDHGMRKTTEELDWATLLGN